MRRLVASSGIDRLPLLLAFPLARQLALAPHFRWPVCHGGHGGSAVAIRQPGGLPRSAAPRSLVGCSSPRRARTLRQPRGGHLAMNGKQLLHCNPKMIYSSRPAGPLGVLVLLAGIHRAWSRWATYKRRWTTMRLPHDRPTGLPPMRPTLRPARCRH